MGRDKFTLLAIAFVVLVWIAVAFYVRRNIPSETESARLRLAGIEEALKTQKRMVELALGYEDVLLTKESSHDQAYRVRKLREYQELLRLVNDDYPR